MPTNPLWLEHTERAAWDTVQSLREQIELERTRVARLVRIQECWPKMLLLLEEAKVEHGIALDSPLQVFEALAAELRRAKLDNEGLLQRLAEQTREHERERYSSSAHALREPTRSTATREALPLSDSVRWFAELIERHRSKSSNPSRGNHDRLLDALEAKLEELEGAPRREIAERAVELASLALSIADGSRRDRMDSSDD